MTRCADDILAFVENSRHANSVATPPQESNPSILFDAVSGRSVADADTLSINWNGRTCYLGFTLPFQLFEALVRRPNRYITREQLLDDVWGVSRSDAAVRSVVRDLRKRLKEADMGDLAEAIDGSNCGRYGLMLNRLRPKNPTEISL